MLLRIASDLHLEGFAGRNAETLVCDFLPHDPRDADSMLVLAGDISSIPSQLIEFLSACLKRFSKVLFVSGNHEYYRHHFSQWNIDMEKRLTELHQSVLADGRSLYFATWGIETVTISDVRFIFGTMWADGGPTLQDRGQVGFYLNDFRLIRAGDGFTLFTVQDMITQYKISKRRIRELLCEPCGLKKTVVVTHHLPSRRLVSARFWPGDGSDGANGGFVGDCDDLLAAEETAPALWIHGHTHDTIDTTLWKTRIVCNPLGYRGEWSSPYNRYMETGGDGQSRVVPMFVEV